MFNEQEFTEIYNEHAPKVYRLCLGYASGDNHLAQEWQQETFIKVWKHRKTFKGNSGISTWIYRIAVNICLSDLRNTKKQIGINEAQIKEDVPDNEEVSQEDKIAKMQHCINQLNNKNKSLILFELEDVPQATIAQTLGIAHGTLRTRLSRIRKTLLKCITNGRG